MSYEKQLLRWVKNRRIPAATKERVLAKVAIFLFCHPFQSEFEDQENLMRFLILTSIGRKPPNSQLYDFVPSAKTKIKSNVNLQQVQREVVLEFFGVDVKRSVTYRRLAEIIHRSLLVYVYSNNRTRITDEDCGLMLSIITDMHREYLAMLSSRK